MAPDTSESIQTSSQYSPEEWRLATLAHSAIAGVSLAATVELANSQNLSNWLLAASVLFALVLPSSVASVVILMYFQARNKSQPAEAVIKRPVWSGISSLLAPIGQLACFCGVLLLFWHLHWVGGVAFTSTSEIAIVTLVALGRK
jgi:uncharacterized membrane protein YesL